MSEPNRQPPAPPPHARTIALLYACFAGLWIVLSDAALRSFGMPDWLVQELEVFKGLAFVAVTSALLYLLLRAVKPPELPAAAPFPDPSTSSADAPTGQGLFVIVLTLILLVPAVGYTILQVSSPVRERETFSDLQAIASLKAEQVELWREGMVAVTAAIPDTDRLSADLARIASGEQQGLSEASTALLRGQWESYALAALIVLNASGDEVGRVGEAGELPPQTRGLLSLAASSAVTLNSELYFPDGRPAWTWCAPCWHRAVARRSPAIWWPASTPTCFSSPSSIAGPGRARVVRPT